jgi:predicted O-methyltransferase YrrM
MNLDSVIKAVGIGPMVNKTRHRAAVRLALSEVCSRSSSLNPVKHALEQAATGTATKLDRAIWNRIEGRRRELSRRTDTIQDIDYGAGHPDSLYSEDQQSRGVVTTMTVKEVVSFSLPAVWSEVMYYLTRAIRPEKALEMGTCVGISGSYIAAAMQLNNHGRLWTIEGSPATAALAEETFKLLDFNDRVTLLVGRFRDELEPCLRNQNSFDLVFVDGHHDGKATLAYFEQLKSHLAPDAVVVFDDIGWYGGMAKAWNEITADPTVKGFVRLGQMGAAVF